MPNDLMSLPHSTFTPMEVQPEADWLEIMRAIASVQGKLDGIRRDAAEYFGLRIADGGMVEAIGGA